MTTYDWSAEPDVGELRRMHDLLKSQPEIARIGLEKLAQRGSMMSMRYLADGYMSSYFSRDLERALYWYNMADRAGSEESSYMAGAILVDKEDYDRALEAFSRGAARGYLPAIYRLAHLRLNGPAKYVDTSEARSLLESAAAAGHLYSLRDLATLYLRGRYGSRMYGRGVRLLAGFFFGILKEVASGIRRGPVISDKLQG